jgi:hypothetical protein
MGGRQEHFVSIVLPEIEECVAAGGPEAGKKALLSKLGEDYDDSTPVSEISMRNVSVQESERSPARGLPQEHLLWKYVLKHIMLKKQQLIPSSSSGMDAASMKPTTMYATTRP